MTQIIRYAHYMSTDRNSSVYSYHDFCGQCRCEIKNTFDSPIYPEHVDDPYDLHRKKEYRRIAFCPWCGVHIEWVDGISIQNERNPDHFRNPGFHNGDSHEFKGFQPFDHWLGTTGGDELCWCKPIVTPKSDGCIISHRNIKRKNQPRAVAGRKSVAHGGDLTSTSSPPSAAPSE